MTELIQNGYSCPREMRLFYDLFFSEDEDVCIIQNFSYENKTINVYTQIIFDHRSYFEDYYFEFDRDNKSEKLTKKIFIAACTRSFSHAAMKIRKINFSWGVMSGIRPAKNVRELMEEGYSSDVVRDIFKNVYEVSDEKTELAMTVAGNERELLSRIKNMDYATECINTKRFRDEFIQYGIGATEVCVKAEFGQ